MNRCAAFFGLLCIVALVLGVVAGPRMRVSHALAASGQVTMVICGQNGQSSVTLDRDGNPVTPAGDCTHCASCLQHPLVMTPTPQADPRPVKWTFVDHHPSSAPVFATRIWKPQARGPPNKSRII